MSISGQKKKKKRKQYLRRHVMKAINFTKRIKGLLTRALLYSYASLMEVYARKTNKMPYLLLIKGIIIIQIISKDIIKHLRSPSI